MLQKRDKLFCRGVKMLRSDTGDYTAWGDSHYHFLQSEQNLSRKFVQIKTHSLVSRHRQNRTPFIIRYILQRSGCFLQIFSSFALFPVSSSWHQPSIPAYYGMRKPSGYRFSRYRILVYRHPVGLLGGGRGRGTGLWTQRKRRHT
jgi:hypothetical protein